MPIYIGHDSADVWANREVFQLDETGQPTAVAGVPASPGEPFGAQRWGSPLYDWDHLQETGFDWWLRRFERLFEQVDLVRIDHFRGLESYWSIPADEPDPNEGEWRAVPSEAFFDALTDRFGEFPAFAEDIGHITDSVDRLRRAYDLPSLRLLPFADWCADEHRHLPPYPEGCVAYTSTHDSNTARGSYEDELNPEQRRCLVETLDLRASNAAEDVSWAFLEAVWESDAVLAMAQLQDVLELGSEARFNTPGEARGQWTWRVSADALTEARAQKLRELTGRTGRGD
jgi:4-alpha-glucanotransferase